MSTPQFGKLYVSQKNWSITVPNGKPTLVGKKVSCGPCKQNSLSTRHHESVKRQTVNAVPIRLIQKNGKIKAGPFIGLLTVQGNNGKFKGNYSFLSTLIKEASKLGFFMFVFTPEGLDMNAKRIRGYSYFSNKGKGKWLKVTVPIPDVVYNRVPSKTEENLPHVQEAFNHLTSIPTLSLFNPHYFDKWELYQLLNRSDELRKYLPPTAHITSIEQMKPFLTKYPSIFLKPVRAKAGFGIICVRKTETDYEFITQNKGVRSIKKCSSVNEVWNEFLPYVNKRSYIIQKAINLSLFEKSPYDLRVLCQKNHRGQWSVTGVGIRHAGRESITTHVPQGGKVQDPNVVLEKVFGTAKSKQLLKETETLALKLAHGIEREMKKLVGEMSMDIGLDQNGKFWFFEANAKPMKFDELHIREKSRSKILDFCAFLAESKMG